MWFEPAAPEYLTRNNRLLEYRLYQDDGQSGWIELRAVKYTYYQMGHVAAITVKDTYVQGVTPGVSTDYDWYNNLALYYASDGKLWRALWEHWKLDEYGQPDMETYDKLAARDFTYDSPRARWLVRDLDPYNWAPADDWQWTDYAGDSPYQDFLTNASHQVTEQTRYFSAAGVAAQQDVTSEDISYLHGDLINSKTLATDDQGQALATTAYTAFGEPVTASGVGVPPANFDTRYQYAGGYGYETDLLSLSGVNPFSHPRPPDSNPARRPIRARNGSASAALVST
jgi:hypothetical protein